MRKLALLASLIPLFASGCAEDLLKADTSQAFIDGYQDGCASGTTAVETNPAAAVPVKNQARYNNEPDYATGWLNGSRECNGGNLQQNPNNPLEQVDTFGQDWN